MDIQIPYNLQSGPEDGKDLVQMFSPHQEHIQESIDCLQHSYQDSTHRRLLINYCFRCHQSAVRQAYNAFRVKEHPEVVQPSISRIYSNNAFIEIADVASYLCGQKANYGSHIMSAIPKDLKEILDDLFLTFGYIPNLQRFLLFYPTFLEKKRQVEQSLFQEQHINKKVAYFLAFCAATELGCHYMMQRYYKLFRQTNGDPAWIQLGTFPEKYRLLLHLNHLMARAIWELDQNTIVSILKKGGPEWSETELAACIEVLAFSHQLSTISLALGLNPEDQQMNFHHFEKVKQLVTRYQSCSSKDNSYHEQLSVVISKLKEGSKQKNVSPSKFLKQLQVPQYEEIKPYMKEIGFELSTQTFYQKMYQLLPKVMTPFRVIEKRRQHINPLIQSWDYNFQFMAYPLLNSLTGQSADRIRDLIQHAQSMTKNNFGSKSVNNTKEFRKAMSHYAQNLCGYRHVEYDYKTKFNSFLTVPLRFYLRLLTISPIHITSQVIRSINHESGSTELFDLGHAAVLIASVKMSLSLTLVMRVFESE